MSQKFRKNHPNRMIADHRGSGSGSGRGRILIAVSVIGSAGPLRFLVNEEELVAAVIETALRSYTREGRLPVLGSDLNNFLLYCANSGSDALSPWETIGSCGIRNFLLFEKPVVVVEPDAEESKAVISRKRSRSWKTWLNKSLNFKVSSH